MTQIFSRPKEEDVQSLSTMTTITSLVLERIELPSRANTALSTPRPGSVSPQAEDGLEIALNPSRHEFSLPPVDGGKDAWLFLAAGFVFEALVWGSYTIISNLVKGATDTVNRLPLFLWCIPRLLQHNAAIRWQFEHCGHRHLCHGTNVPSQSFYTRCLPAVCQMGALRASPGTGHHVRCTRSFVVLYNRGRTDRYARHHVRCWRQYRVQSSHAVYR